MSKESEAPAPKVDFCMKFTSEKAMMTQLKSLTITDDDGKTVLAEASHDYAIDRIGKMYKPTGKMIKSDDGIESPEMKAVTGYHINVRLVGDVQRSFFEALDEKYGVNPKTPQRVFA